MTTMTHDAPVAPGSAVAVRRRVWPSRWSRRCRSASPGTLAKGLLVEGWSPAAAVTARIVVAALVLRAARRWWRCVGAGTCCDATRGWWCVYGVVAVAGCQFAYFSAVEYLQVGVALLLEYTAPVVGHRAGCGCATASDRAC